MNAVTEAPQKAPTLREAMRKHMGPVVAIVESLDGPSFLRGDLAGAVSTLSMNAYDHLKHGDEEQFNANAKEWWDALALCAGIAAMVVLAAGELPSTRGRDVPDEDEAFTSMQTYAEMIRERWIDAPDAA